MDGMKRCTKCQQEKPESAFGKDCRRADGLFPQCKRCRLKDPAKYDEFQQARSSGLRRCCSCKQWLDPSKFGSNRFRPDGLHTHCRGCTLSRATADYWKDPKNSRAKQRANSSKHRDKRAARWKAYYVANAHRLILKSHQRRHVYDPVNDTLTDEEWQEILREQGGCCARCKRAFTSTFVATRDHIVPLKKGGFLTKENTQALCRACNARKGNDTIDYRTKD